MAEDGGHFSFWSIAIDRYSDQILFGDRKEGGDEIHRVRELDGDPITGAESRTPKMAPQLAGACQKSRACRDAACFAVDHGRRVGRGRGEADKLLKHGPLASEDSNVD